MRGGVDVGFRECIVHAATQHAVLERNPRDTCERRREISEEAYEDMSRHVLRFYLRVSCVGGDYRVCECQEQQQRKRKRKRCAK